MNDKELKTKNEKVKKLLVYAKDGCCVGSTVPYNSDIDFYDLDGILYFGDISINKDCFAYAVYK